MPKTNKCTKCGLHYRKQEWHEKLELTHCYKCRVVEQMLEAVRVASIVNCNRKIKITWEIIKN